jgi:amphi-Trp domain-containing protein
MKTKRHISRWSLARRLQDMALRVSAGRPIRIGGILVRLPDQVVLEEEVETKKGKTELELELKWPATTGRLFKKPSSVSSPRRKSRSTS